MNKVLDWCRNNGVTIEDVRMADEIARVKPPTPNEVEPFSRQVAEDSNG